MSEQIVVLFDISDRFASVLLALVGSQLPPALPSVRLSPTQTRHLDEPSAQSASATTGAPVEQRPAK